MQIKIFRNLKKYTLTSAIKKSDIDLLQKHCPSALKKQDAEGNEVFGVSYNAGRHSVSANGVTFGAVDADNECVMFIGEIPETLPDGVDAKGYVADRVGVALTLINEMEASIPVAVATIKAEREALISRIAEV